MLAYLFNIHRPFVFYFIFSHSFFFLSSSFFCFARCIRYAPRAAKNIPPIGEALPPIIAPKKDKLPNISNTHPHVFIRSFFNHLSTSTKSTSFFFEQSTTIKPNMTLISAKKNAQPKPILRFRPIHPTPYANATAIHKKNNCSIYHFFNCVMINHYSIETCHFLQ